jgi:tRNA pseudouridine55 synthase
MSSLVRTRTGKFSLEDCITIEELENMTFEDRLKLPKPVESLFMDLPEVSFVDFYAKLIRGGTELYQKKLKIDLPEGQLIRIRNRGEFIALGRGGVTDGVAVIKPEKLFVIDPPKDN